MPLFLSNEDQERCIKSAEAIDVLENAIRQFARGDAIRRPRIDNLIPTSRPEEFFNFSSMEGGTRDPGYYALRIKPDIVSFPLVRGTRRRVTYSYQPGQYGGLVFLYSTDNAELVAIMNDGYIQHIRVAATVALGVRYLAKKHSRTMGIYGTGGMARAIPLAAITERPIERLQVYNPNREHLEQYCEEMTGMIGCKVLPAQHPEEVCEGADIVCTCTTSLEPVLQPDWIRPGMHLNNITPWELSTAVCDRVETVGILIRRAPMSVAGFVDDDFSIRLNVMSYAAGRPEERASIPIGSPNPNRFPRAKVVEVCNWATGEPYERRPDEITILANASKGTLEGDAVGSTGMQGIQFASVAGRIYETARNMGIGRELPRELFLQDLPT